MVQMCSMKFCFCFFNTLFLATGIAIIIIGTLSHGTFTDIGTFTGSPLSKVTAVLIAIGVTITIISFVGYAGVFFQDSSLICAYIFILSVIIILQIFTGTAFYVFRQEASIERMNTAFSARAKATISEYRWEDREAIDVIQLKFMCCGAKSHTDWHHSKGWGKENAVPSSCCKVKTGDENCGEHAENLYQKGCIKALKVFLMGNLVWVGAVCIILGIAEVFGVVIGICVRKESKRKNYENMG